MKKKIKVFLISLCVLLIFFSVIIVVLKPVITVNVSSSQDVEQPGTTEKGPHEEDINETNKARSAEEILKEEYYPRYRLLKEVRGNFSPCGNIKTLFLLNDTKRHLGNPEDIVDLHKVLAYDEQHGKMIEHPYRTGFVNHKPYLLPIIALESKLGSWNGYFYTYDLNQNGVDEIIGFGLFSSQFFPEIYEYRDGGFVKMLDYADYSGLFSRIEIPGERQIKIFGYGDSDALPRRYPWKLYEWNEEEQRYAIIEEGSVTELPK